MTDHYDQRESLYAAGSFTSAAPGNSSAKATTIADMEVTMHRLRGMPPAMWMLIAPDGRVWAHEDPLKLLAQIAFNHTQEI